MFYHVKYFDPSQVQYDDYRYSVRSYRQGKAERFCHLLKLFGIKAMVSLVGFDDELEALQSVQVGNVPTGTPTLDPG